MRFRPPLLTLLGCAFVVPAALAQAPAHAPVATNHVTVVELFTSQGCSSCPAADAVLKTFVSRPELLPLSLAVDYWDHLGWKDTLASPKNSARQRSYAKSLGTGNVYTPQVVVDGFLQAIGSNKADIEKAISKASQQVSASPVSLIAISDARRVTIEVGAAKEAVPATVWLAIVSPQAEVEIKRGENRGKALAYHNVVRDISPIGMWAGKPMKIELPVSAMAQKGDRCVVLLQADDGGRILAATWMTP